MGRANLPRMNVLLRWEGLGGISKAPFGRRAAKEEVEVIILTKVVEHILTAYMLIAKLIPSMPLAATA